MEFLTTPDISAGARWVAPTPTSQRAYAIASPTGTVSARSPVATPHDPRLAARKTASQSPPPGHATSASASAAPHVVPGAHAPGAHTPCAQGHHHVHAASPQVPPDRLGIKHSFQSLFSPDAPVHDLSTPALMQPTPTTTGLTPFINGLITPSLVPLPHFPSLSTDMPHAVPSHVGSPHDAAVPTAVPPHSAAPSANLSTPFLQAAAKEAVRREFLNMPSFGPSDEGERCVPSATPSSSPLSHQSPRRPAVHREKTHDALLVESPDEKGAATVSTTAASPHTSVHSQGVANGAAANPDGVEHMDTATSETSAGAEAVTASRHVDVAGAAVAPPPGTTAAPPAHVHPYFMQHAQPQGHGGMVFVGPHGHMMMAPPHGMVPHSGMPHAAPGLYPGAHAHAMMMFGGQPPMMPAHAQAQAHAHAQAQAQAQAQAHAQAAQMQNLMMQQNAANANGGVIGAVGVQAAGPTASGLGGAVNGEGGRVTGGSNSMSGDAKNESHSEKKARIEQEKQDLIREFKKKTREAALVRFRQKRSERRFGKLIRYDCRKKLADARPRVKGRFVRIKNGEFEEDCEVEGSLQVVPNMVDR